jgi:prepilin-type N-terminal cleavage/methylation domain-containing protein
LKRTRSGFSLLEVLIALVVVALIFGNVAMVVRSSDAAYSDETSMADLDLQLDQTLERIAVALMSASVTSLDPNAAVPAFHTQLEFVQSLGVQDGRMIQSDPERIELVVDEGRVVWKQRPDSVDERMLVWSRWVSQFLEGEVRNGVDDNGNGAVDENGLVFLVQGSQVTIHLTLSKTDASGRTLVQTRTTVVTCRN